MWGGRGGEQGGRVREQGSGMAARDARQLRPCQEGTGGEAGHLLLLLCVVPMPEPTRWTPQPTPAVGPSCGAGAAARLGAGSHARSGCRGVTAGMEGGEVASVRPSRRPAGRGDSQVSEEVGANPSVSETGLTAKGALRRSCAAGPGSGRPRPHAPRGHHGLLASGVRTLGLGRLGDEGDNGPVLEARPPAHRAK